MDWDADFFRKKGRAPPIDGGYDKKQTKDYQARYDTWEAARRLEDVYLECGWDKESTTQDGFRKAEFLERRNIFWQDVVRPLREREEEIDYENEDEDEDED